MKKIILLLMALLFSACTTTPQPMGYSKSHNYNHKPYLELKFKRQQRGSRV